MAGKTDRPDARTAVHIIAVMQPEYADTCDQCGEQACARTLWLVVGARLVVLRLCKGHIRKLVEKAKGHAERASLMAMFTGSRHPQSVNPPRTRPRRRRRPALELQA